MQLRPRVARALSTTSSTAAPSPASRSITTTTTTTRTFSTSSSSSSRIKTEVVALADAKYATGAASFFKIDYSKGDVFIGVRVPQCRAVVKAHIHQTIRTEVIELLQDPRHEVRIAGGICLVEAFTTPHKSALWLRDSDIDEDDEAQAATNIASVQQQQQQVVEFYLEHLACFDNWDLVDLTSYKILGAWMVENHLDTIDQFCEQIPASATAIDVEVEKAQLAVAIEMLPQWYQTLLHSTDFWETRVSIVLLLGVRRERVDFAIHICKWHLLRLLDEEYEQRIKGEVFADYDLVHKACGWVLRECGRGDRAKLLVFLERYAALMPRTTLQYATEHLDRKLAKSLSSQGKPSPKKQRETVRSAET